MVFLFRKQRTQRGVIFLGLLWREFPVCKNELMNDFLLVKKIHIIIQQQHNFFHPEQQQCSPKVFAIWIWVGQSSQNVPNFKQWPSRFLLCSPIKLQNDMEGRTFLVLKRPKYCSIGRVCKKFARGASSWRPLFNKCQSTNVAS